MKKLIGKICLLFICVCAIPFSIPHIIGWNIYEVKTSSMEPTIPKGSVIFVDSTAPKEIESGDVVAFYIGTDRNNVVSHRVCQVDDDDGLLITKGDGNDEFDADKVHFSHVIGKVRFCVRNSAVWLFLFNSANGKIFMAVVFLLGSILLISSDIKKINKGSNNKEIVHTLCFIAGIALICFSAYKVIDYISDLKKSNDVYEIMNDEVSDNSKKEKEWYNYIDIDISDLKKENQDIIGWIFFEDEDISYPVLYSGDNERYLYTSVDNRSSRTGSIFMEAGNKTDFMDLHTILYGHNMKDLSMFGKLRYYYQDEEYYKNHQYFQIVLDGKKYRYQIFGYEKVLNSDKVYTLFEKNDREFESYIDYLNKISYNNTGVNVSVDDKIVTLSTCTNGEERFVVHGVLIDSYIY